MNFPTDTYTITPLFLANSLGLLSLVYNAILEVDDDKGLARVIQVSSKRLNCFPCVACVVCGRWCAAAKRNDP